MKWIKYKFNCPVNVGTEEEPAMVDNFINKAVKYCESGLAIAQAEAYNGEYTIEDDGVEENTVPTQLDIIEAQVTYTAMMTDTLLEV